MKILPLKIRDWKSCPKQTILKSSDSVGDCWRCCIAAILGMPHEQVPHFLALHGPSRYMRETSRWLDARGMQLISFERLNYLRWPERSAPLPCIATGPTSRSRKLGEHHAVLMDGDTLLYDPHPSESGLTYIGTCYMIVRKYVSEDAEEVEAGSDPTVRCSFDSLPIGARFRATSRSRRIWVKLCGISGAIAEWHSSNPRNWESQTISTIDSLKHCSKDTVVELVP